MGAETKAEIRTPEPPDRLTIVVPGVSKGVTAAVVDLDRAAILAVGLDYASKLLEKAGHAPLRGSDSVALAEQAEEPEPEPAPGPTYTRAPREPAKKRAGSKAAG